MTRKEKNIGLIIALIFLGIASRFIFIIDGVPSFPNFTALGAVALFGSYFLKRPQSMIIPLVILWISDIVLNNVFYSQYFDSFSFIGVPAVYLGFAATVVVGWYLIKKLTFKNVILSSFVGAIVFYLITNFGTWLTSGMYTKDISGLLQSYWMGIPFFRNALLGNLFFSGVLFGAHYMLTRPSSIKPVTA